MSSEMRFSLVFSIALCMAMPAAAQMPYGVFVVPVVVKAPGEEGSNWMTDFSYTNLGDTARKFGAHYFPTRITSYNVCYTKLLRIPGIVIFCGKICPEIKIQNPAAGFIAQQQDIRLLVGKYNFR